jgi:hypothetical protein
MKYFLWAPMMFLVACAPSVEDVCDRLAQCGPGTPEDVAECKTEGNRLKNESAALGCDGEFDDYLSCVDGLDVCDESALESGCKSELDAMAACGDEQGTDDPQPG